MQCIAKLPLFSVGTWSGHTYLLKTLWNVINGIVLAVEGNKYLSNKCVNSKSLSMQEPIFYNLSFDLPGFLPRALLPSKISQVHSHVLCCVLFLPRTSDVFWLVLIHFWTLFLSNVSSWRRISGNFGNDGSENVYNVTW